MATAAEVVREWKRRMREREFDKMSEVVDLDGYTENCLRLTGWTTGFAPAFANYRKNLIDPWTDMQQEEVESVEGSSAVASRLHIEATHSGRFMGIEAPGRRISWDAVVIVYVKNGRVVGQWAQPTCSASAGSCSRRRSN